MVTPGKGRLRGGSVAAVASVGGVGGGAYKRRLIGGEEQRYVRDLGGFAPSLDRTLAPRYQRRPELLLRDGEHGRVGGPGAHFIAADATFRELVCNRARQRRD